MRKSLVNSYFSTPRNVSKTLSNSAVIGPSVLPHSEIAVSQLCSDLTQLEKVYPEANILEKSEKLFLSGIQEEALSLLSRHPPSLGPENFNDWVRLFRCFTRLSDKRFCRKFSRWFSTKGLHVCRSIELIHLNADALVSLAWGLMETAKITPEEMLSELIRKIGDELIQRIDKRSVDLSLFPEIVEIYSGRPPATVHRPLLLIAYCVLLEKHNYKKLTLDELIRVLRASAISEYQHKVLVNFIARELAIRIAKENKSSPAALSAVCASYANLSEWGWKALAKKAASELTENSSDSELVQFLVSYCHVPYNISFSGSFIDLINTRLSLKSLMLVDPQSLAGICVSLARMLTEDRNELVLQKHKSKISCACQLPMNYAPNEDIDYKALRVVVKPVDVYKKAKRRFWMRQRIPDFVNLYRKRKEDRVLIKPQKKDCDICREQSAVDLTNCWRASGRAFTAALVSTGFQLSSIGRDDCLSALDVSSNTCMIQFNESAIIRSLPRLANVFSDKVLREIQDCRVNPEWTAQRESHVHWSISDVLMAIQMIFFSGKIHHFHDHELSVIKNLIYISQRHLERPEGRHPFIAGARLDENVFDVKSVLNKLAPRITRNFNIQMEPILTGNFKTDILFTNEVKC